MKDKDRLRKKRVKEYKLPTCPWCESKFDTQEKLDYHLKTQHGSHQDNHSSYRKKRLYGKDLNKTEAMDLIDRCVYSIPKSEEYYKTHPVVFDKNNTQLHNQVDEKDRLYSLSGKSFCHKLINSSKLDSISNQRKINASAYITLPKDEWSIFGGSLKSRDDSYIDYYLLYNKYTDTYEMYSSWGTRIRYMQEEIKDNNGNVEFCMDSYCPVDVWRKYKRKQKGIVDTKSGSVVDYFIGN